MPEGIKPIGDALVDDQIKRLGTVLDEEYDEAWLAPGEYLGTATAVAVGGGRYLDFADGSTQRAMWVIRVNDEWLNHYCTATVYYTSSTGGTATFDLLLDTWTFTGTDNLNTGGTRVSTLAWSAAGPGVAYDLLSASQTISQAAISSDAVFLNLRLSRDGAADTNNNALIVAGIKLEFYRA